MIDWTSFTPLSLVGGLLIGLASVLLWWGNGKIAGVSGILANLLNRNTLSMRWQWAFVMGLLLSPWLYRLFGSVPAVAVTSNVWQYVIAGLIVGFGTRLGSGCTSGHGICGNARLSKRSMVATATFMLTGFITLYIGRHLLGIL